MFLNFVAGYTLLRLKHPKPVMTLKMCSQLGKPRPLRLILAARYHSKSLRHPVRHLGRTALSKLRSTAQTSKWRILQNQKLAVLKREVVMQNLTLNKLLNRATATDLIKLWNPNSCWGSLPCKTSSLCQFRGSAAYLMMLQHWTVVSNLVRMPVMMRIERVSLGLATNTIDGLVVRNTMLLSKILMPCV